MSSLMVQKKMIVEFPRARIWPFIATREGLSTVGLPEHGQTWWITSLVFDAYHGGTYDERGVYAQEPYHLVGKILTYESPRLVILGYWEEEIAKIPTSSQMILTIELIEQDEPGTTAIFLKQTGFDQFPLALQQEKYNEYNDAWDEVMKRLYQCLQGDPNVNPCA